MFRRDLTAEQLEEIGKPFIIVSQGAMEHIADNGSTVAVRLVFYLQSILNFSTFEPVDVKAVAKDLKCSKKAVLKALDWLFELVRLHDLLDFKAYRQVRMQSIADDIGTDISSVSRGMKDLVRVGILERQGSGPRIVWRFSSNYGWDGTVAQYHAFTEAKRKAAVQPAQEFSIAA